MGDPGNQEIEVIQSWSAPRSISTALMYSFAQVCASSIDCFVWSLRKKYEGIGIQKIDVSLDVCVGFWFPLDQELTPT